MTAIRTVFFDWGGVVADDPGDDFLASLLRSIGATDDQVQEIFDTYMLRFMRGEISEAQYWDALRQQYGLSIHDTISDEFKKWRGLEKNHDILSLIDSVKNKGYTVAMLSNIIEPTYNALASEGNLTHFDAIIASCKVGFAKPQEEIYQVALRELRTTAEASLFIDDKQRNLDPANRLGFTTVLAQNPAQIITDVSSALEL